MANNEAFRKDRLEEAINSYGIEVDENIEWSNEKLVKALGDYFISLSPDLISSIMMCIFSRISEGTVFK